MWHLEHQEVTAIINIFTFIGVLFPTSSERDENRDSFTFMIIPHLFINLFNQLSPLTYSQTKTTKTPSQSTPRKATRSAMSAKPPTHIVL
jgi:hypothetical protein